MVGGQSFQAGLQVVRAVCRAGSCLVRESSLVGQMVVRPRHPTAFRTFGDRAIVTGYPAARLPSVSSCLGQRRVLSSSGGLGALAYLVRCPAGPVAEALEGTQTEVRRPGSTRRPGGYLSLSATLGGSAVQMTQAVQDCAVSVPGILDGPLMYRPSRWELPREA